MNGLIDRTNASDGAINALKGDARTHAPTPPPSRRPTTPAPSLSPTTIPPTGSPTDSSRPSLEPSEQIPTKSPTPSPTKRPVGGHQPYDPCCITSSHHCQDVCTYAFAPSKLLLRQSESACAHHRYSTISHPIVCL